MLWSPAALVGWQSPEILKKLKKQKTNENIVFCKFQSQKSQKSKWKHNVLHTSKPSQHCKWPSSLEASAIQFYLTNLQKAPKNKKANGNTVFYEFLSQKSNKKQMKTECFGILKLAGCLAGFPQRSLQVWPPKLAGWMANSILFPTN